MQNELHRSNFWKPSTCLFAFSLFAFCLLPFALNGQCDPAAAEIPNNGIDEDCDDLDDVFLVLPPFAYAVVGQDLEVYFRNCILSQQPDKYVFEVNTPLGGLNSGKKWGFLPTAGQVGEHPFSLSIKSGAGQILATASMKIRISPASPPADLSQKKLWLYGHSFFDQGYMPKYLADLLAGPGNPPISYHGKKASWAPPFPKHEGYGGMMWRWFIHNPGSPFRYGSEFSLTKYFDEVVGPNQRPDWAVVHLDINDFCGYSALAGTTLQEIDDSIQNDWALHANRILDSIRMAAPNMKLAICLSPMPNARQSAFDLTYAGNPVLSNRWRWQKIISRLLFANIAKYQNRENERIWLIPEYLDVDDFGEYNPPDARHLDPHDGIITTHCGYNEIAKSIYAWLKYIENLPFTPVLTDFWKDADGDNYGNAAIKQAATSQPPGFVANPSDCDDANPNVHPGAAEICGNNLDEDCDGTAAQDTEPPVLTCKTFPTLLLDSAGELVLTPGQMLLGQSDACSGIASLAVIPSFFSCQQAGTFQNVQVQATDFAGNIGQCSTSLTILDQSPPVITCRDSAVYFLDGMGQIQVSGYGLTATETDNCTVGVHFPWQKSFSCGHIGLLNAVEVTVWDMYGNFATCTATVIVKDTTPPGPECKPAVKLPLDNAGLATLKAGDVLKWQVTEACGAQVSLSKTAFSCTDLGSSPQHLMATDPSGNQKTCPFLLNVVDEIAPVLTCKPAFEITLDLFGQATIQPADLLESVSDNCGNATVSLSQTQFSVADLGEKTIELTATDGSGNVSACPVLLTVKMSIGTNSPANFGWKIGPNPTGEKLFLENETGQTSPARLKIFDSTGRLILENTILGKAEIGTADWPAGFYQLEIRLENGLVLVKKLVVFH